MQGKPLGKTLYKMSMSLIKTRKPASQSSSYHIEKLVPPPLGQANIPLIGRHAMDRQGHGDGGAVDVDTDRTWWIRTAPRVEAPWMPRRGSWKRGLNELERKCAPDFGGVAMDRGCVSVGVLVCGIRRDSRELLFLWWLLLPFKIPNGIVQAHCFQVWPIPVSFLHCHALSFSTQDLIFFTKQSPSSNIPALPRFFFWIHLDIIDRVLGSSRCASEEREKIVRDRDGVCPSGESAWDKKPNLDEWRCLLNVDVLVDLASRSPWIDEGPILNRAREIEKWVADLPSLNLSLFVSPLFIS